MLRTWPLLVVMLLLSTTTATPQEPAGKPTPSKNLLTNPTFAGAPGASGLPQPWSAWSDNETKYRYAVVDGGRSGKKCLKIEGEGTRQVIFANKVPLDRGKRYVLKGWARCEGDAGARALIKFNYFHNGEYLGINDIVGVTPKHKGWQPVSKTDKCAQVPEATEIWISCNLEGNGTAWFDELELVAYDRKEVPDDFDVRFGPNNVPAEQAVLQRRIGTWFTETVVKPGVWVPDGAKTTGVETIEWVLNKKFIKGEHKFQPGDKQNLFLETFSVEDGVFRSWFFNNDGIHPRGENAGTWDEKTQSLNYKGTDPKGVSFVFTLRFVSGDRHEWSGVWRQDGRVVMEMEGKLTRKK